MADRQACWPGRLHCAGHTGPKKYCYFALQDRGIRGCTLYIWVDRVGCVAEDRVGISVIPELMSEIEVAD